VPYIADRVSFLKHLLINTNVHVENSNFSFHFISFCFVYYRLTPPRLTIAISAADLAVPQVACCPLSAAAPR
jgi:hypothetical protein